jgi:hypothetical protein
MAAPAKEAIRDTASVLLLTCSGRKWRARRPWKEANSVFDLQKKRSLGEF